VVFEVTSTGSNDVILTAPLNELNGYSLNEVFNDNNIMPNYNYLSLNDMLIPLGTSLELVPNGVKASINDTTNTFGFFHGSFSINIYSTHQYYFILDFYEENIFNGDNINYFFGYEGYQVFNFDVGLHSGIVTPTIDTILYNRIYSQGNDVYGDFTIKKHIVIDLTDLDIDLTKEQMDYYYNYYVPLSDNQVYVDVYNDNWSLSTKTTLGNSALLAPITFFNGLDALLAAPRAVYDFFANISSWSIWG